jgi:hypothetical protein
MVTIPASQAVPGMWVMRGGARRQLTRRPGPAGTIELSGDQGFCAACGLPLVPGMDDGESDERATLRSVGADHKLRYFCVISDDGGHHPRMETR